MMIFCVILENINLCFKLINIHILFHIYFTCLKRQLEIFFFFIECSNVHFTLLLMHLNYDK